MINASGLNTLGPAITDPSFISARIEMAGWGYRYFINEKEVTGREFHNDPNVKIWLNYKNAPPKTSKDLITPKDYPSYWNF